MGSCLSVRFVVNTRLVKKSCCITLNFYTAMNLTSRYHADSADKSLKSLTHTSRTCAENMKESMIYRTTKEDLHQEFVQLNDSGVGPEIDANTHGMSKCQ